MIHVAVNQGGTKLTQNPQGLPESGQGRATSRHAQLVQRDSCMHQSRLEQCPVGAERHHRRTQTTLQEPNSQINDLSLGASMR